MNQEQMNVLLDVSLSMGCDLLERNHKFFPFAVTLDANDEVQRSGEIDVDKTTEEPQEIFDSMKATLEKQTKDGQFVGFAIGIDTKAQRFKSEGYIKAINSYIQHSDGNCFECFLPYRKEADGSYTFGQVFAQKLDNNTSE